MMFLDCNILEGLQWAGKGIKGSDGFETLGCKTIKVFIASEERARQSRRHCTTLSNSHRSIRPV